MNNIYKFKNFTFTKVFNINLLEIISRVSKRF